MSEERLMKLLLSPHVSEKSTRIADKNRQFVFKVVDGAGGKISQRLEVKTGLRLPGKVEVLGGLAPGDLVVTAGQARLMRGESQPVRLVDLDRIGQARPPGTGDKPGRAASGGAGPVPAASGAAVATSR